MSQPVEEVRPIRPCDSCGQEDDHPRAQYQDGVPLPDGTPRVLLFHYDCVPAYVEKEHPLPAYAAAKKGLRNDELRAVVTKHQAKLAREYAAELKKNEETA